MRDKPSLQPFVPGRRSKFPRLYEHLFGWRYGFPAIPRCRSAERQSGSLIEENCNEAQPSPRLRLLQAWVVATTAGLAILGTSWLGEAQATRTRFTEIDVERINIVESDGRVRLVIAIGARPAGAVMDGRAA